MATCLNIDSCPYSGRKLSGHGMKGGIMLVGDYPLPSEILSGEAFRGKSGRLFTSILKAVGLIRDEVYLTNLCCKFPYGNRLLPQDIVRCKERLIEEIEEVNPKVVILLGPEAASVAGWSQVNQYHGHIKRWNISNNCSPYVLTSFHPLTVFHAPDWARDLLGDLDKANTFYKDLLSREVSGLPEPNMGPDPITYTVCKDTAYALTTIMELRNTSTPLAVDIETDGLDFFLDPILAIGVSDNPDHTTIFPRTTHPSIYTSLVKLNLKALLEDRNREIIFHNGKFDTKFLKHQLGIDCRPTFDTMYASYALDERAGGHGLKGLASRIFNAPDWDAGIQAYLPKVASKYSLIPVDKLHEYLASDVAFTYRLYTYFRKEMGEEDPRLEEVLLRKILQPAANMLRDVELSGVLVDIPYLEKLEVEFTEKAVRIRQSIHDEAVKVAPSIYGYMPEPLNPNSVPQLKALLFDIMDFPNVNKGSTDKETIGSLQETNPHPILDLISEYRSTTKIKGTYITGLLKRVHPVSGKIHPDYKLHGTRTGRQASENPNLQNIPVLMGPVIRKAFIAPEGYTFVSADYSQLEIRVAAHYSGDPQLIEGYSKGMDIHRRVAAGVFYPDSPLDEGMAQVTTRQRRLSKLVSFGVLYGRTAMSLATPNSVVGTYLEDTTIKQAQTYIDNFWSEFNVLASWMEGIRKSMKADGYVTMPTGRKRRFPLLMPVNIEEVEREAVNSPIQGLASDICLTAQTRLHSILDPAKVRILFSVHDSIEFEVRNDCLKEIIPIIKAEMEKVTIIDPILPFIVDIEVGKDWGSCIPYEECVKEELVELLEVKLPVSISS